MRMRDCPNIRDYTGGWGYSLILKRYVSWLTCGFECPENRMEEDS